MPVERFPFWGAWSPFWVAWSPDGAYLFYNTFHDHLVAVPVDQVDAEAGGPSGIGLVTPPGIFYTGEPVILYAGAISRYDGYPDTSFVPIQNWGNRPSG